MRILITGSSGFVGRHLYKALIRATEHEIYVVTRKKSGLKNQIFWDFNNKIPSDHMPKKIDVILHFAQSTQYKEFPGGANDMFHVNVQSTAVLLDYAIKASASHFILMSTGSVYEPYLTPCLEDAKVKPISYYPASKYCGEVLAHTYNKLLKVCIFRLFFPYGSGQIGRLIPELIKKIDRNTPIKLAGKGGGTKITPLFIDNLVEIVLQAVHKQWEGTINLASPEICSIQKISETLAKLLNKTVHYEVNLNETPLFIQPGLEKLNLLYPNFDFVSLEQGLTYMMEHEHEVF